MPKPNAAQMTRLRFIDAMLAYHGHVQREHICDFHGISVPQASKDLGDYQQEFPGNMVYNASNRRYEASSTYRRRLP